MRISVILLLIRKVVTFAFQIGLLPEYRTDIKALQGRMSRVLLLQLQYLGDSIIFTPVLRGLKEKYPGCVFDVVVNDSGFNVYKSHPGIGRVYLCSGWRYKQNDSSINVLDAWKVIRAIRKQRYDCVLMDITETSFVFSLFAMMTGIKDRIGFAFRNSNYLNTYEIKVGALPNESFLRLNLRMLETICGQGRYDEKPWINITAYDRDSAIALLAGIPPGFAIVGFSPFASQNTNRWPDEQYAQLARILTELYRKTAFVMLGGPAHTAEASALMRTMPQGTINLVGKTSVSQLAAIFYHLSLLITSDSGPMHLCALREVPTVRIMSGRNPDRQWAYDYPGYISVRHDVSCSPCYSPKCATGTHECMRLLTVEDVMSAISRVYPGIEGS